MEHFGKEEITFGKYLGKTLEEIYKLDKPYYEWAMTNLKSPKWQTKFIKYYESKLNLEKLQKLEIKNLYPNCVHNITKENGDVYCSFCGEVFEDEIPF